MTLLSRITRGAARAAGAAVIAAAGGCAILGYESIQFTNVSEAWLNVRFYVGESKAGAGDVPELVSRRAYQIAPGETARFKSSRTLVHIQVETITPTWEPPGSRYWLELMTHPPVHIVATGKAARLDFQTGSGEVAIIPEREQAGGRFEYVNADRARAGRERLPPPAEQQVAVPDKQ